MGMIGSRIGMVAAATLAATSALVLAAPSAPPARPVAMSEISSSVEGLPANCRRIAERRLKASLDRADEPFITRSELHRIVGPLAGPDGSVCDEITGQSFLLGGT
jgi:hypothetical protein